MLNVKFNCNCIALLCPLKEVPLKTWRLDRITSFGQSGGILTFESCATCSDPALTLKQGKKCLLKEGKCGHQKKPKA